MYFLASDLVLKFSSSFPLVSTERSVGVVFFILLNLYYYNKKKLKSGVRTTTLLDISLIRNRYCHKASQFLGGNAVSFGKAC